MNRILILVEGFTEEAFVRDVLRPYLLLRGVWIDYTIIKTKRVVDGPDFKGGIVSYAQFRKHIIRLLADSGVVAVTSMIDYYGLSRDFPGKSEAIHPSPQDRVRHVEQAIATEINNTRFRPHLMLHEFEAFVFVAPEVVQELFPANSCETTLRSIRDQFATPEEINDSPLTAPSKRLDVIFGETYQKPLDGPLIALAVGLERIRLACPHFDEWLTWLESFAKSNFPR